MEFQLVSQLQKYFSSLIYSGSLFLIFNVFICFITPCYSCPIKNQDDNGNKLFDDLHSTINFSKSQFRFPLTIEGLCKEISTDKVNIPSLEAPNNTIDWLNELLKVPNFYDILDKILKERNPRIKHSKKIDKLVRKTEKYRNKNFCDLSEERQFNIKKLNRILLEETYPLCTPNIKNHILEIQRDGRLCEPESHGKEKLIKGEEYSEIFNDSTENVYIEGIIENINNWSPKNGSAKKQILIFIHGGLNDFEDSYNRVRKLLYCCENKIPEDVYPIFINWESGILSAYFDYVLRIRQGDKFYKGQKLAWTFAAPFIVLGDFVKGVARMPYLTGYQIQNYCKTFPSRHELATEEINKWYLDNKNKDQPKPIKISNVKYEHNFDRKRFLEDLPAIPQLPFKLLTNAMIDGAGKGAWETMVRRTQTMFNSPEESKEDAQLIVTNEDRENAKVEAVTRVIPKPTGALSKFMDTLQRELKNPEGYEFNLIGHSMGTIVMNEILHRYRYFTFNNIVYMAAACSINDFRINVIPYLRRHRKTRFYNLCLHPLAEQREIHYVGLIPRGSFLEWLDNFLTSPNTTLDRRMGKWENILRTTNIIPDNARERIFLKAFEFKENTQKEKEEDKQQCNKCKTCHTHSLQKPPQNPGNPQKHSEFTNQQFWEENFWNPKKQ